MEPAPYAPQELQPATVDEAVANVSAAAEDPLRLCCQLLVPAVQSPRIADICRVAQVVGGEEAIEGA